MTVLVFMFALTATHTTPPNFPVVFNVDLFKVVVPILAAYFTGIVQCLPTVLRKLKLPYVNPGAERTHLHALELPPMLTGLKELTLTVVKLK